MTRILVVLAGIITLSGCATITRGTQEAFAIETTPAGATAKLSTGTSCTTPCSVKVKRKGDFTVLIEKEGFETVTASITSGIDGAGGAGMAGNVLLGGIIGAGIDAGSGAMHSHKPNPLQVTLTPAKATRAIPINAATADTYDQLLKLDELRQKGVISEQEFESQKDLLLGASKIEVPDVVLKKTATEKDASVDDPPDNSVAPEQMEDPASTGVADE